MWLDVFKPKPVSRAGYLPVITDSASIGTGGITVAGTATTSVQIPIPATRVSVQNFSLNWLTAAASTGAVTVQVQKVDSAGNVTALCAATSIKNDVLTGNSKNIKLPVTSTLFDGGSNASRIIDGTSGDSLRVDIVAAASITTQPQLIVAAEVTVLN